MLIDKILSLKGDQIGPVAFGNQDERSTKYLKLDLKLMKKIKLQYPDFRPFDEYPNYEKALLSFHDDVSAIFK